ncbi:methyltransferase domain-containing protein [Candidatus Pyrohabitans sp.]
MKLLVFLSGEHATLPRSEVLAVFEALDTGFEVVEEAEQVLVLEGDFPARAIAQAARRTAMAHFLGELYFSCKAEEEEVLACAMRRDYSFEGSFAVRVHRVRHHAEHLSSDKLEREIGAVIAAQGKKVNLSRPENSIVGIISGRFFLARILERVDRGAYEERRPHLRPYFRPGVILPRLARAVVNLTRVRRGERFADPFCGTGGILLEAGLVGAEVYGFDVEEEFLRGAEVNFRHYGVERYHLEKGDARLLWKRYPEHFHAIACDPPYGISASTKGLSLEKLYQESLTSIYRMLIPGRYACVLAPSGIDIEDYASCAGFKVVETHLERVHRSLVRKIVVLRKA